MNAQATLSEKSSLIAYPMQVTPEQAEHWIAHCYYKNQRHIREDHIQYLTSEIKNNRLKGSTLAFCLLQNKRIMVNGHHTCYAVIRADTPITVTINEHVVQNEDEVAEYYASYDSGLNRNVPDVMGALGLSDKTGLGFSELKRCGAAVNFITSGFRKGYRKVSKIAFAQETSEWAPYFKEYVALLADCPEEVAGQMFRSSTLAVALVTVRHCADRDKVENFWKGVAFDDGLRRGDPRKTLRTFFLTTNEKIKDRRVLRKFVDNATSARTVGWAWNHYYIGKEIKIFQKMTSNKSFKLHGTPTTIGATRPEKQDNTL